MYQVQIKDSTDKRFIDEMADTDLFKLTFPSGEIFEITGRCHIGNGLWRLWNKTYTMEVQEVKID